MVTLWYIILRERETQTRKLERSATMYSVLRGAVSVFLFLFVCLFFCLGGGVGRKDAELGRKLNWGRKGIHVIF